MHHSIRPVRQAVGGKAQGLRVRRWGYVALAALISFMLTGFGGTKVDVHGLFQALELPFVGCKALNTEVELTIAARGGRSVDEGDAERQGSGKRAAAEFSVKRSASGSSSNLSVCRV
jgi:hypothetical protein